MSPAEVAELVLDGIRERRLHIFTHPEMKALVTMRADRGDGAPGEPYGPQPLGYITYTADGHMHAVQEAFHQEHGLQCGFCTPGMVMAIVSMLKENPSPTEAEVRTGLEGNICRCTGYHNIVRAALAAAEAGK